MDFRTINVVMTELTASLNFTDKLSTLCCLSDIVYNGIIWINGGNCRLVAADQLKELFRTATLLEQIEDETEIKKGQPPQHRIYWDDCPALPSDLSQLLNHSDESNDHSANKSVGN
jgi:hypothetical protein